MEKKLSLAYWRSFLIGFLFCAAGMGLCIKGLTVQGIAFFFFLPLSVGISSGLLPDFKKALLGTVLSLFLFGLILIITQLEGLLCILMALPIVLIGVGIGYLLGLIIKKARKKEAVPFKLSLVPFLLFLAVNTLEMNRIKNPILNKVSTTCILDNSPEEVYDKIIAVDTVNVALNPLQYIGLPIPRKCELSKAAVGGLRICTFEDGTIVEQITALEKGRLLKMNVLSSELSRKREWLKFEEDIYSFSKINGNKTSVTRTTTYYSNLYPRFYWAILEAYNLQSEQDFVFRNLAKDLQK